MGKVWEQDKVVQDVILLKNLFTEKQLKEIKDVSYLKFNHTPVIDRSQTTLEEIYAGNMDVIIDQKMGKAQVVLSPEFFSSDLIEYINNLGKSYNENVTFTGMTFTRYAKEYGWPQLMPHIDHPSKISFIIDLQINSNISWPLCFLNESYDLKDGESILMRSTLIPHWRKPQIFQDSEFVEMVFIYFHDFTLDKDSEDESPSIMNPINNEYHKKREKLGIPDFFSKYNPALEEQKIKALKNN